MKENDKEDTKETTNSSERTSKPILKEKKPQQEENKKNIQFTSDQLNNNRDFNSDPQKMYQYMSQRHLYDHKKQKQSALVNITDKNLQLEYISEVNYLFKKFIFIIFFSLLIFIQSFLILHNYKNFTEVILCQIFSAFAIFNSVFLIVELYRDGLRDQFRYSLFRLFSLFLCCFLLCIFYSETMNVYIMYDKIQGRKEKCLKDKKYCGDTIANNIILGIGVISFIGILYLIIFPLYLGYRSIKILLGFDFEVHQKQMMINKKINGKNENIKDNKNNIKQEAKKDINEHLKKD